MKKILGLLVGFSLCLSVFGQNTTNNADIQKAIEIHDNTRNGDYSKIQTALDLLKPYIQSNALACAYYGSSLTLLASECSQKDPIKSLDYLQKGAKYLDSAVQMDSSNPVLHLFRLENGIEVSRASPVKRYSVISEDVDFLLDNDLSSFDKNTKAEAFLYCGYYKADAGELDDALDLFDQAIEVSAQSLAGKAAQKMIDKYSE